MNFDRNYLFYEDFKERSPHLIQKQRDIIQPIIEKNLKHFVQSESHVHIPLHRKIKPETEQKLKKLIFQDKSYIYYTDNLKENSNFEIGNQEKLAIFSVHACPGNHTDWQKLQNQIENNKIRWINFVVPGYDGEDERRGEYLGEFNQILEMMKKLIDFLQLEKVFLLLHSIGSIIGLHFQDKYPNLCLGHIMLGAVAINWTFGIKAYYEVIIGQFGEENQQKLIEKSNNDDDFRDKIFLQYQRNKKDQQFEHPGLGILKLADLDINQFWATFKIYANTKQNNWDKKFSTIRNQAPILKFMAGGDFDLIIGTEQFEKQFHYFTYGPRSYKNEVKFDKQKLKKLVENCIYLKKFKDYFDYENVQNNFIYLFENTGHQIIQSRSFELAQPILIYIRFYLLFQNCITFKQHNLLYPKL